MGSTNMTRREALVRGGAGLLGMTAAGSLLAACGSSGGSGGKAATVAAVEPASGDVTYWYTVTNAKQKAYQQRYDFDAFTAANPRITLETSQKPLDTIGRVTQTALQAGKGPDVVVADGPAPAAAYARAGSILALDEYAREYGWNEKILPWALEAGRLDGKLYSLPMSYESMVLFRNETLFEEKGWSVPRTRADIEAIATDAMGQGIVPFAAGNAEWKGATEWFVTAFFNNCAGPEAMEEALTGRRRWTDPLFEESIALMADWFRQGWFGGGVEQFFSNRFDPLYAGMARGRYAMNLEGTWAFANMTALFDGTARYDWSPLPSLRDGVPDDMFTLGSGGTWSVNSEAQSPGAAAAYIDWQFSDPRRIAEGVAAAEMQPTPLQLTAADFPAGTDPKVERFYIEFGASTGKGTFGYTTWTFMPPKSNAYLAEEVEKVLIGSLKPADYLAGLDRLFASELKRKDVPPIPPQAS